MNVGKKNFRWWHVPVLLCFVIATCFIVTRNRVEQLPYQSEEGSIFGTIYHIKYQSNVALTNKILHELHAVDKSLSMFNPHSTISRINRGEDMHTDSLIDVVWKLSQQVSQETDGAFDPTCGPLVNAWGFGFKNDTLPTEAQVDTLLQFVGMRLVDVSDGIFHKQDPRITINFSAIAKGFAVDQVANMFNRQGIENYMVEIGGEVIAKGLNAKGKPWRIGINKPVEHSTNADNEIQETVELVDDAIATSGNYRNYYIYDGVIISHTIDPKSGYPVRHSLLSSTVWAPSCAVADAYATAFMVMGIDKAKILLQKHPELKAYFIFKDEDGEFQTWTNR
ncbi:MAG: FAD:protein FMN transferase [Bacteroidaceae bacterium]|nr:FAD:protein FMN transferase [Bacteroidaceae bacterium]